MNVELPLGRYHTQGEIRRYRQALFLKIAACVEPALLRSLRDGVLPVYTDTYAEVQARSNPETLERDRKRYEQAHAHAVELCHAPAALARWTTVGASMSSSAFGYQPDLIPLRTAVEKWGSRFHLETPWVFDAALFQLELWRLFPRLAHKANLRWGGFKGALVGAVEGVPPPAFDVWDPLFESREQYEQRHTARMAEYLDGVEKKALPPGIHKRPKRSSAVLHLTWLAHAQVKRRSWSQIASEVQRPLKGGRMTLVAATGVSKFAWAAAREICLPLDPVDRPGRPLNSKTKNRSGQIVRSHRRGDI